VLAAAHRERLRSTLGGPLDGTLAELALFDQEAGEDSRLLSDERPRP